MCYRFILLDSLKDRWDFPDWKKKRYKALLILLVPTTLMTASRYKTMNSDFAIWHLWKWEAAFL